MINKYIIKVPVKDLKVFIGLIASSETMKLFRPFTGTLLVECTDSAFEVGGSHGLHAISGG